MQVRSFGCGECNHVATSCIPLLTPGWNGESSGRYNYIISSIFVIVLKVVCYNGGLEMENRK